MPSTIEWHVKPRVLEALQDTRIVAVQGARQVGKTTLVRDAVGDLGGRLVTFDDEATRAGAQANDQVPFAAAELRRRAKPHTAGASYRTRLSTGSG